MTVEGLLRYPFVFLASFALCYLLVPRVARVSVWLGAIDHPSNRRIHSISRPRGGGIALFVGVVGSLALLYPMIETLTQWSRYSLWWMTQALLCSSMIVTLGFLDDVANLRWVTKLLGQVVVAGLMFISCGGFGTIFGVQLSPVPDLFFTIIWFCGFMNAFNLIDGMDGLASGLAAIAAAGLAVAAVLRFEPLEALLLIAVVGSCLAFLRFNFHPAIIFLGDSGSLFLGFSLAAIALQADTKSSTLTAVLVPMLAVGVPVFDTMLAVWRRSMRRMAGVGLGIAAADLDHLHHRLLKAGLNQRRVAYLLYAVNGTLVTVAIASQIFASYANGILLLTLVVGSYVMVAHFARVELWDSGAALARGLKRPTFSTLSSVAYPALDLVALSAAVAFSLISLNGQQAPSDFRVALFSQIPVYVGLSFVVMFLGGVYSAVWSRARISEFAWLGVLVFISAGCSAAITSFEEGTNVFQLMMFSLNFGFIATVLLWTVRAAPRLIDDVMGRFHHESAYAGTKAAERVLVYGAGIRGQLYLRDLVHRLSGSRHAPRVVGFVDDDVNLRKRYVFGLQVHGTSLELPSICSRLQVSKVVVASEINEEAAAALKLLKTAGIAVSIWELSEREFGLIKSSAVANGSPRAENEN